MTTMARIVRGIAAGLAMTFAIATAVVPVQTADAAAIVLCTGYEGCARAGYSSHDYKVRRNNLYWRMIGGHNCTNYAAYILVRHGLTNVRPWSGSGDAQAWGDFSGAITDHTPVVGAIAWWNENVHPAGASGHVAYVEKVISATEIVISEDNFKGQFYWKRLSKSGGSWPSGFIHFKDARTPPAPALGATLLTSGLWTSKDKSIAVTSTALSPGQTVWVEVTYRNAGAATWRGVTLGTTHPVERTSPLATGWLTPTRVVAQSPATVKPGAVATFGFAITVPADATPGTEWIEHFAPVTSAGSWMLLNEALIDVAASALPDFAARPRPTISGVVAEGEQLTANVGSWSPMPESFSYQWYRDGVAIAGADQSTFVLGSADVGTAITVEVTATATGFNPSTQRSALTATVTSIHPDRLLAGETLLSGGQLVSANGRYQLLQRTDGNLMIYDRRTGIPLWASGRATTGATTTLTAAGELVTVTGAGKHIWSSLTGGRHVSKAILGSDGQLRLYTAAGTKIWSSLTSGV